jgi:predicted transcriptional regulator of viral defense system
MLARWASKGWLSRIRRGLYVPVPLESRTSDVAIEEPWHIAQRLYEPCYIGGWSAAAYWGLTEQLFRSVLVFTCIKPLDRAPTIKNIKFVVHKVSEKAMFGLQPVWKGSVKILVSDPSRTVIDMLDTPSLGGGIRPTVDVFLNYLKSPEFNNMEQLTQYADRLGNGAVYKRLGFLLEQYAPGEKSTISVCASNMTKGNSKLDPKLASDRLVTKWRLWIPENWAKEKTVD